MSNSKSIQLIASSNQPAFVLVSPQQQQQQHQQQRQARMGKSKSIAAKLADQLSKLREANELGYEHLLSSNGGASGGAADSTAPGGKSGRRLKDATDAGGEFFNDDDEEETVIDNDYYEDSTCGDEYARIINIPSSAAVTNLLSKSQSAKMNAGRTQSGNGTTATTKNEIWLEYGCI